MANVEVSGPTIKWLELKSENHNGTHVLNVYGAKQEDLARADAKHWATQGHDVKLTVHRDDGSWYVAFETPVKL